MNKILIYDDEQRFVNQLRQSLVGLPVLKDAFEIDVLDEKAFKEAMEVLTAHRQLSLRQTGTWRDECIPLDEASIFVVDFDLLRSTAGAFLTSEHVAYLVRCFSACGLIVGLNLPPYRDNVFDLTLKGHPESFADLNIGGNQLGNPNLWGGAKPGFRPWHWPVLPDYQRELQQRVSDVKGSLADDIPIWEVIGFPVEVFEFLPRSIGAFLGKEPAKATFRQFVLESGNGLRPKDAKEVHNDALARIGAARISKWLERLVLPGQDILVDAPHMVSRYPSLMASDVKAIKTWNATAKLTCHDQLGLSAELIEPFRLKRSHWLSRPVWFWEQLRTCEDILEVREPWKTARPDWAFCEDASRFYRGKDCREFVADVESPFSRRYVRRFQGVSYRPAVRFAL